jgi:hypothetical protein
VLLALAIPLWAADKPRFLTPRELAELGDKSKVAFATKIVETPAELPALQHPGWPPAGTIHSVPYPAITTGSDGSRALVSYRCSDGAMKALEAAEPSFQKKAYDAARVIYEAALHEDPSCYILDLSAGDCSLFSGNPEIALQFYEKATKLNPADYHGQWFRASALVALGRSDEAKLAYTQALALSPANPRLLSAIKSHAAELGIEVRDVSFRPSAVARVEGKGVTIYTVNKAHWWIYGLCKGLWLGDDAHRIQMSGDTQHNWTTTEDLECIGALLAKYETSRDAGVTDPEEQLDMLLTVLDHKLLGEFVLYEFGRRVSPDFTILLTEPMLQGIARYVDSFVLPSNAADATFAHRTPPEICDIAVRADLKQGSVLLTWKGGTSPFMVVRSKEATLSDKSDVTIIESSVQTRALSIPEHPGLRYPYWYQVFDANAAPEAFSVKPAAFTKGQLITLRGVGFSNDCALNRVTVGGFLAEDVRDCSRNGLKFRAPVDSGASGIRIQAPAGDGGVGDQQRCKGSIRHPQTWQ